MEDEYIDFKKEFEQFKKDLENSKPIFDDDSLEFNEFDNDLNLLFSDSNESDNSNNDLNNNQNNIYPNISLETDDFLLNLVIKKDYSKIDSHQRKKEFFNDLREFIEEFESAEESSQLMKYYD